MKLEPVRLDTIAGGAAVELFQHELQRVLDDIDDPNTDAEKVRTITLTISIKPSASRDAGAVEVATKSKIAGVKPHGSVLHFTNHGGRRVALTQDPTQLDAFTVVGGKEKE